MPHAGGDFAPAFVSFVSVTTESVAVEPVLQLVASLTQLVPVLSRFLSPLVS